MKAFTASRLTVQRRCQPITLTYWPFCRLAALRRARSGLDASLVRVLEDLVDVLISRNVIRITDLPPEAQKKLFERKRFRESTRGNALKLIADHDDQ